MAESDLEAVLAADRNLRAAEARLMEAKPERLVPLLQSAVREAESLDDGDEAEMRLARLADLCAQVAGPEMVDALIRILDHDAPAVRVQAADALVDVGFERYAEVARGVERALEDDSLGNALQELPWVIAEIGEPSALPLIERFLRHNDAETAASAVEAAVSLGDPEAVELLEPLREDDRIVELDRYDREVSSTLGELVQEALDALQPEPQE